LRLAVNPMKQFLTPPEAVDLCRYSVGDLAVRTVPNPGNVRRGNHIQ